MSYNTTISIGFGITFIAIMLAGFALAFSTQLSVILLGISFAMNLSLWIVCFFKSVLSIDDKDWDLDDSQEVHP